MASHIEDFSKKVKLTSGDLDTNPADEHMRKENEVRRASIVSGRERGVLMIAFHFPPQVGSSGHLRSLKYCRYLPKYGWMPTVLTVHPRAYERVGDSQLKDVPGQLKVVRAFALDTRKHLSFRNRYLKSIALPDRWVTWCLGALPNGLWRLYHDKTEVIYTTFPVASAVLIGYILNRITRVPWVADFRDPMTEDNYPADPETRHVLRWLEKKAAQHASRLIFTSPSTMRMYQQRYPGLCAGKCQVISNGYDEEDFSRLPNVSGHPQALIRMQHSGVIYPQDRDPIPFFNALSRLKRENQINASSFSVDLRACGDSEHYIRIVAQLGIEDLVHFPPALPYAQALEDSNQADILLLLQGPTCDAQIPAKTYEYLRLGKPILALTTSTGDTAAVLNECGGATILDITDEEALYRVLPQVLNAVRMGTHPFPKMEVASKYSRQHQAQELACCLSDAAEGKPLKANRRKIQSSAAEL